MRRYGAGRGERMVCALTHDDPVHDCHGRARSRLVVLVVVTGAVLAVVLGWAWIVRRRKP